jgi:hypothetical protein
MQSKSKLHKLVGLLGAMLLLAQAALPVSAFAELTMRCSGPRAHTVVCSHALVAVKNISGYQKSYTSLMPCCRSGRCMHMGMACHGMMGNMPAVAGSTSSHSAVLTTSPCRVSVHYINDTTSVRNVRSARNQFGAKAPLSISPVIRCIHDFDTVSSIPSATADSPINSSTIITSHGLRAPPLY